MQKNRWLGRIGALALCAAMMVGCASQGGAGASSANALPAPASTPAEPTIQDVKPVVNMGVLQGPSGLGMVELMERNAGNEAGNLYDFTLSGAPDELNGKIINGELDIAAVPTNVASVLYNRTGGKVKIIAVSTLGVLYVVDRDGALGGADSIADLAGETVHTSGQGATQEYVLDYLLAQNGAEDARVEFYAEHAELAAQILAGEAPVALLPEPFVTSVTARDESVRVVFDITQEWQNTTGRQLAMGAVVVREEFLEKNPEAVNRFLEEYRASVEFVNQNVQEAAALSGKYDIVAEEVAAVAIPKCNVVCLTGLEMQGAVAPYLEVLHGANAAAVGDELPDEAFYYIP